jgi:ribonucleoside-diphosphate reductase alpha chain
MSKSRAFELSENARVVLERRYLAKDDAGNLIETPEELFRRVARNVAEAEGRYTGEAPPPNPLPAGGERESDVSRAVG